VKAISPVTTALLYLWLWPIASSAAPISYEYKVIAERSHHTQLFTQGLLLHKDTFYESSGLYGKSMLVSYPRAEPEGRSSWLSARPTQRRPLPADYFAEGLTLLNDKLYLLTWRENTLLVYDRESFSPLKSLRYEGEGWGLTDNGEELIRSDGSHRLYFHAADDFRVLRHIQVMDGEQRVERLNELEYIEGRIWANIWGENRLVQINPVSGQVTGYLDLTALVRQVNMQDSESVLNGIAYDKHAGAIWVTGKNWPKLFLLRLQPALADKP
jgi:glutamine cyclotransferase